MKRLFSLTIVVSVAAMAFASLTFGKVFTETYNIPKSSKLGKANCMLCHTNIKTHALNGYGKDLAGVLKGSKKLTPDALKKIENLDSNKNGVKNIDEIKADKSPGV